jgi:hypothetical protein
MAVDGIGNPADMPADAEGSRIEFDGQPIAQLRDAGAVDIEPLAIGAGVLVVGADDVAPGAIPERARDVVLQPVVGAEEVPREAAAVVVEDCMETSIPARKQTFDLPQRQRKSDLPHHAEADDRG